MPEPIMLIDVSDVRAGRLDELRAAITDLARFVEAHERRPLAYSIYLDPAGTRMTVIQIHPDSASLELHMTMAAEKFARFADLVRLARMDIYGHASEGALELLRRKAQMLGGAGLFEHRLQAGFVRTAVG
jgi:hypothetical protein